VIPTIKSKKLWKIETLSENKGGTGKSLEFAKFRYSFS
jgi:hypothetical protein